MEAAQASRYVTLMIPGFIGLVLTISIMKGPRASAAAGLVLALLMARTVLPLDAQDQASMQYLLDGKTRWKECYLLKGDYLGCNESTNFVIYPPGPDRWAAMHPEYSEYGSGPDRIVGRLNYLKVHHLNLFLVTK